MGLQLRIRHALKARIVEIPRREGNKPIRVGRDDSCEVMIPLEQVGPVHCLLYAHDDQWVVASSEGSSVSLNGQEISEPHFIDSGDKISLGVGPSVPMIEVDPSGLMRQQAAAVAVAEADAEDGSIPAEKPVTDEFSALEAACGTEAAPIYIPRPPKPVQKYDVRLVAGVIAAVVVVGILLIWMLARSDDSANTPVVKPAVQNSGSGDSNWGKPDSNNIFGN